MSTSGVSPTKLDNLPEGTVTFLFTDIEGSTELLKQLGDCYADLLGEQRKIVRTCCEEWEGQEVDTQGDSFFVSFSRATQAVSAAVEIQREIQEHEWPDGVEVRLRMGLHTGEPLTWAEGYVGIDVHRAARIAAVGHGGQVLLSQTTTPLIRETLPDGISLIDLGRHRLKDLRSPERIGQLVIEGMPSGFPPLTSLEMLPDESPLMLTVTRPPPFLEEGAEPPARPTFVAREKELAWLNERLDKALEGEGQIAFVTGGPGRGKSALLEEFMRRVIADHPDLLAVRGESSAHTGVGDPYQPFRGALGMLLGDLEGAWASGLLDRNGALKLWEAMPWVTQLLLEVGPDLLGVLVSGRALHDCLKGAMEGGSNLLVRLGRQVDAERPAPSAMVQRNLFEQAEGLLIEITAAHPLILVLDDLQWADTGSINLLFHLMRRVKGRRLLILGAFRPEEIALGRGDEPHPLEKLLAESKRLHGEITLDLGVEEQAQERAFIDAYIDSEANALGENFRKALADQTGGHALFTVELLRAMQERGDLVQDESGQWIEGESLDWNTLPARVEGVIEERIGRLEEKLRETLTIASVEGETFTAQVVAQVQEVGERKLIKRLSQQLEKKHRLIEGGKVERISEKLISLYRFSHALYQRYLYNDLDPSERIMLHGDVAHVLENLYEGNEEAITVQLAHHWGSAGELEKAERYLQRAGDQARLAFAHDTAISYYQRAIEILKENAEWDRTARSLMKLGLTHQAAFEHEAARKAFDEGFDIWQNLPDLLQGSTTLPGATFRYLAYPPTTLDPGKAADTMSTGFIQQLFCGLVELTPELGISPALAESWEISDDGGRIVFHLRDQLYWSDGNPLTANDVEFAWKRNLRPEMFRNPAELLYVVKGAENYHRGDTSDPDTIKVHAVDERTLEVEIEKGCGYFLYIMAHNPVSCPLPQHALEAFGDSWMDPDNLVCNGPFVLMEWVKGKSISLKRNPYYSLRYGGNLDRIEILMAKNQSYLASYESDQFDVIELGLDDLQVARDRYPNEYIVSPDFSSYFIIFNVREAPFSDIRVRQAFALAIDREAWSEVVLKGSVTSAKGGLIPPMLPGSTQEGPPFDPQKAIRHLADAGFPQGSGFPSLTLLTNIELGEDNRFKWVVNQWNKILGVNVQLEEVEWDEKLRRVRSGQFSIIAHGWVADYPDPDSFLRTNVTLFQGGWDHPEFNQVIERARNSRDQIERVQLYKAADRIVIEDVPTIPLHHGGTHFLVKPWVISFPVSTIGNILHGKDIIVEPH
jgi:ABC-type oligopeptide transport system substrate-binding subunit/class 3 adenylate cyclase